MTKRNCLPLLLAVALIWCSLWIDTAGAAVVSPANATAAETNGIAPHSTTASTPIATDKFVPFPESQCHIPFWHNGVWHHTCIKYNNFGDFWCSLSANFTRDENWIRCKSPDLERFQCQIPFEFDGKNHTECLPLQPDSAQSRGATHSFWCAVVPKIVSWSAGATDWAYCEHPSATGIAYLKEVGTMRSIPAANITAAHMVGVAKAVAENVPVKSLSGGAASGSGSSGATAGLGAQATVGISVGVVCSVLAVAAVVAGFAIRKRRRSRCDHKALLRTREKGTYGGVDPSD